MNMPPPWNFRLLKISFMEFCACIYNRSYFIQNAEAGEPLESEFEAILSNTTKLPNDSNTFLAPNNKKKTLSIIPSGCLVVRLPRYKQEVFWK